MGKKLYVGNLSYDVDSSQLEQLFSAHGTVESAQIINDRDTGRSKGFGFVEMSSDAEAQAAIAAVNGQEHGGRERRRQGEQRAVHDLPSAVVCEGAAEGAPCEGLP